MKLLSVIVATVCSLAVFSFAKAGEEIPISGSPAQYASQYWQLEKIKTTAKLADGVVVYIALPSAYYLRALDEDRLKAAGCKYETLDKALLSELIEIIGSSGLRQEVFSPSEFEPRESIYFYRENKPQLKFLFGREFVNSESLRGEVNGQQISIKKGALKEIYKWVAKLPPVEKCNSFIDQYRQQ